MDYKEKYEQALERAKKFYNRELYAECNGSLVEYIFPELKESGDEKIRKEILNYFQQFESGKLHGIDISDWISWLEKQGEQKQIRPIWKYKKDHTPLLRDSFILNKYGCVAKSPSGALVSDVWVLDFDELAKLPKEEFERQSEQKPADKVEPKFKAGDWVVYKTDEWREVLQIENIELGRYIFTNGSSSSFAEEKNMRLWTIQDAKDGDVLATSIGSVCIFDNTVEDGIYPFAYCGLTNHGFEIYDRKLPFAHDRDIHPATKEQRDLLFQKMKEAGYEWDAEKKELKKIEQKPAWSGEDLCCYDDICEILINLIHSPKSNVNKDVVQRDLNWIMSISDRIKPQAKPAWSEEEEEEFQIAIDTLAKAGQHDSANWLKSLKERVQPQPKQDWSEGDEKNRCPLNIKEIKVGDIITYFRDGKKGIMLVSSFDAGIYPRCKWGITNIDGTAYGDWAPGSGPYYIATENEKQQLYDTMPIEVKNWLKSLKERMKGE